MVQVRDAKASQLSAEQATNALRTELTQLSGRASAGQEMASMWQGRAEGIQQHLDQAMPWQGRAEGLQEQLDQATARAESLEQQLAQAVQQTVALEKAGKDAAAAAAVQEDCIRQVVALAAVSVPAIMFLELQGNHNVSRSCLHTNCLCSSCDASLSRLSCELRTRCFHIIVDAVKLPFATAES